MGSGSEEGSYLRRIDFLYHPTIGLRVIKKKKKKKLGKTILTPPVTSSSSLLLSSDTQVYEP